MVGRNDPCPCGSGNKYKKCCMVKNKSSFLNRKSVTQSRMVKNADEINGMRVAGKFNGEVMDYIRPYVKTGISTEKLNELIHNYTIDHGHTPACLGYNNFPKSACLSINNIVCHGIPSEKVILKNGDIINVDLTSIVNGFHGDSSETFIIGSVEKQTSKLVQTAAQAMVEGINIVRPGLHISEIGKTIQTYVEKYGYSIVRQYTGHGIGRKFHENFSVYHHIDSNCEDITLLSGMTLTIEPMVNIGNWQVITDRGDGWTVRTKDGSLSAQFEHTILVTDDGVEVLTQPPSQKAIDSIIS